MLRVRIKPLLALLLATMLAMPGMAQPKQKQINAADLSLIAEFEEAAALDVDPSGLIYVVDQGAHSLLQFDQAGSRLQTFGGPGDGEGQFDSPADIDATNGLVLVIADAGNGRIQRFSREFLFLETLQLGDFRANVQRTHGNPPGYRQRSEELSGFGSGRPIAVITSPDNKMYAIDETASRVAKWDKNRNIDQYIGAFDQGAGSLVEPVAIALNENALYVADRAHDAVMVYDAFGGFDRTMAEGRCSDVKALHLKGDQLVIVKERELLLYEATGMPLSDWDLELDTDLVDVAIHNDLLYVLTARKLYALTLPF